MLKIANYLNGIVRVKISGAIPEKFINLCLARGIYLWGITKQGDNLYSYIRLPDFFRIRPLVKISQSRVSVVGFSGWPFTLKRIKRRKMLIAGAVLFFIALNILTSYIWFVDVVGPQTVSSKRVKAIAGQKGLKPGASKHNVDMKAVESEIILTLPEVAWAGVSVAGTRAIIEVVEKTLPKKEDKSPANIIAAKDGVITEIITIAGQAAVKKGDTVKKGDVLIRGFTAEPIMATPGQTPIITLPSQFIRANGIVKARVWYESYGEAGVVRETYQRTGRQVVAVTMKVKEHELVLKHASTQPFPRYETEVLHKKLQGWRNSGFAVESTINIFHEVAATTVEVTMEEARDDARGKALQAAQALVPETAQVLSRNIEILKTAEPGLVRVKVSVETIEDIGQTSSITQQ
jgi:similar to stage IV sporulation protein